MQADASSTPIMSRGMCCSRVPRAVWAFTLAGLLRAAPVAGQVNLSGNVRCDDGTRPEMIPVYAYAVGGPDVKVRHTDEQGNYTFLLPNGSWIIEADPHYASWWPNPYRYAMYRAEHYNNAFFYTDATPLVIAPGVTHSNINFVLERYADIKGRVVNAANQQPLAGMPVGASVKDGSGIGSGYLRTMSDTNGEYVLHVNVGQWRVYADPEGLGFAAQYWSNKTDIAGADLVTVGALGETHGGVNFSLTPVLYGKVSGTVYRPDGSPAQWAAVNAYGNTFYPPTVYANSAGYWEMTMLQPDTYTFYVYQSPYPMQYYCGQYGQDYAHRIAVPAGADIQRVDFLLDAPARIAGRVRTRAGVDIPGAYVGYTSAEGAWGGVNTDGDGMYAIDAVPPGHYRLYASAAGYLQSWYSNRASEATADRVSLEAGQAVSNIDFTLDAGGTIAGVVSNASGGYAGGVQVLVTPAGVDPNLPGFTEHYSDYSGSYDGRFTVRGIRRTPCVMRTMGVSYKHTAGAYYDRKLASESADVIDLAATDRVENAVLYVYAESKIGGRITAASGGAGLGEVTVYILTTEGYEVAHGESDESGNYLCGSLAPGTYIVLAAPMFLNEEYTQAYAPRYYGGTSSPGAATRITLTEGTTRSGVNIALLTASGGISGRVTRAADGAPIEAMSVYIWTTGVPAVRVGSAGTDASGNYTVRGLSAGTYRAQTWPNNFGALQFYNGKSTYAAADNITVGSTTVSGINFALAEVAPSPYAPSMRQPLPPVRGSPVLFEWTAIEGARFYDLRVDDLTAGVTGVILRTALSDTQHASTFGFVPNHRYRAQVRAGNSAGYGEYGAPLPVTYLPPPHQALTVLVSGPGGVTLDPPGGRYAPGTVVTLTATGQDGSTFDHWSNVDSPANQPSAVVTVTVARTVTAYFIANRAPAAPACVAPGGGDQVSVCPLLQATAFADPDAADAQAAALWQVAEAPGDFGSPVYSSETAGADRHWVPPGTLTYTSYLWRVRYRDNFQHWSDWSSPAGFDAALTVDGIEAEPGGTVTIVWPALVGYLYTLHSTTDLVGGAWAPVAGHVSVPGTGGLMRCEGWAGATNGAYYRVTVEPAAP